jgi:hypothetical protein
MNYKSLIAVTVLAVAAAPTMAQANSITGVESARAKERQGAYLSSQDVDNLSRYGGNADYGTSYGYAPGPYVYGGGYYDDGYEPTYGYGPTVGIYIGSY